MPTRKEKAIEYEVKSGLGRFVIRIKGNLTPSAWVAVSSDEDAVRRLVEQANLAVAQPERKEGGK